MFLPGEERVTDLVRYLIILELMESNAIADCECHAVADTEVVAVNFKRGVIHAPTYTFATWRAHGYRKYPACVAVRAAHIEANSSLFALLTDMRPQR